MGTITKRLARQPDSDTNRQPLRRPPLVAVCDPSPEGVDLIDGLQACGRYQVTALPHAADAVHVAADAARRPPLAVITTLSAGASDSGPGPNGLDVMGAFARTCPETTLIAHANPRHDLALLRVAWASLQPFSVLDATEPAVTRVRAVLDITQTGQRQIHPNLLALLPDLPITGHRPHLDDLVAHPGHATLWRSLLDSPRLLCPATLAQRSHLPLATIERYLAHLASAVAAHGLADPTVHDLQQFARTNRARLTPLIESELSRRLPTATG